MAFTAVTGVLMPRMSLILSKKNYNEFQKLIRKSVRLLLIFSVPCILIIEVFAPQIIYIIAGSGYEGAIIPLRIIAPLVLIIGIEQILITQSLTPLGKDKEILKTSILGAVVGLSANIVLVPRLASIGSAIVWLISEISVMFYALHFFNKEWKNIKADAYQPDLL